MKSLQHDAPPRAEKGWAAFWREIRRLAALLDADEDAKKQAGQTAQHTDCTQQEDMTEHQGEL